MKKILLAIAACALVCVGAQAQDNPGVNSNPVYTQGAITTGNCIQGVNTSTVKDAGAPCGTGTGTPGGSTTNLQYNNAGAFGGFADGTSTQLLHGGRVFGSIVNGDLGVGAVTDDKASLLVKPAVTVVATANTALSGLLTIDSVVTADGSVVLATAQTTGSQNGPWTVHSGAWTRPAWYSAGSTTQAPQFLTTHVRLGTLYSGSTWRMTTGAVTVDTTATTWAQTPMVLGTTSVAGLLPIANGGTATATPAIVAGTGITVSGSWPNQTVTSKVLSGAGSPESAVTAPVGSLYTRTDGGASTTLYVKESGAGNTGWIAK